MQKRSLDICTAHRGRADGAAPTHLIMFSVRRSASEVESRGAWEKDAICGNCTDVPLRSDTILTAGFVCADSCMAAEWNKHDDTQSKIIRHKCIAARRIMLSNKF